MNLARPPALVAQVLLAPAAVTAVPDDVLAAAVAATMDLIGHDHCCPPWDGWRADFGGYYII